MSKEDIIQELDEEIEANEEVTESLRVAREQIKEIPEGNGIKMAYSGWDNVRESYVIEFVFGHGGANE